MNLAENRLPVEQGLPALRGTVVDEICNYVSRYEHVILRGVSIGFHDRVWDFTANYKHKHPSDCRIVFSDVPEGFGDIVRFFAFLMLRIGDNKISTVDLRIDHICTFLRFTAEKYQVRDYSGLCDAYFIEFFCDYVKSRLRRTCEHMYYSLEKFIWFLNLSYFKDWPLLCGKKLSEICESVVRGDKSEYRKTPDIPFEYFDSFLKMILEVMRNESLPYDFRATAACYVLLSQLGIRVSELLSMTDDLLRFEAPPGGKEKAAFFKVRLFKEAHGNTEFIWNRTFATPLAVEAYLLLRDELTPPRALKTGERYIYQPTAEHYPVRDKRLVNNLCRIMEKYGEFARCEDKDSSPYPGIPVKEISGKYYAVPSTRQFRVHCCTELYYTYHVDSEFIRRFMGHLSKDMECYYVRPADKRKEEAEESEKLLREVITGDAELLGGHSAEMTRKIKEFLANSGKDIRVLKDVDELVKELQGEVAIRNKTGGFCVKAVAFRPCEDDFRSNEFMCAFGVCPNLMTVYWLADGTYKDFKDLQVSFKYNLDNGFEAEASRELKKLKAVCRQRLVPEMQSLKKRIDKAGAEQVVNDYPQLRYLVENYDKTMEEIEKWRKMQM